jgi:hypothetical protein
LSRQQDFIKTQVAKSQLSTGSTVALILGFRQISLCKTKPKYTLQIALTTTKKALIKEHYTEIQDLQFLLDSIDCRC